MEKILTTDLSKKILVLGNEAIVRGALEGGVDVATTYPGTPSSEIGDTFFKIAREMNIYFEFSINERVAIEVAGSASVSGLNAVTFMKHVGLNVASDAFMSLGYTGVRGAHIIISADDPHCHSSQNEQDNRYYAKIANIPMLEPSTPQEAKEMMRVGMGMSHKLELPILLRTTTRMNHVRAPITLNQIRKGRGKVTFEKDPYRFVIVPEVARKGHLRLLERMKSAEKLSEETEFNFVVEKGDGEIGIITSGVSYNYVREIIEKYDLKAKVLKLGMTNPLPERKCVEFMNSVRSIIIIEELEPFLEDAMKVIAKDNKIDVPIHGKSNHCFPRYGEFNPDIVMRGMARFFDLTFESREQEKIEIPTRPPILCSGCPHRASFYAAKKASKGVAIYPQDIGCYTLSFAPPLNTGDLLFCMGSSVGTAGGFSKITDQKVIAFIGDSTFFHAGIPGLINAVHNKQRFVLCILDNSTTAMTGHQPHPGLGMDGLGLPAPSISIPEIVKACGVKFLRIVDPNNLKECIKVFKDALEFDEVAVVITKRKCIILELRDRRRRGERIKRYTVDKEKCNECHYCIKQFACPAFYLDNGVLKINKSLCYGCGVCPQICPRDAIIEVSE